MPGGLTLSAAGVLSGTTFATAGLKALRVTVTDANGLTAAMLVTMRVAAKQGRLYAWGTNTDGTIAGGSSSPYLNPVVIPSTASAIGECSEQTNSFAVLATDKVIGWGKDDMSQLGDGSMMPVANPKLITGGTGVVSIACGDNTLYELTAAGQVYALGVGSMGETGSGSTDFASTPSLITSLSGIVAISAGEHFALALTKSGTVYAWGDNADGELGVGAGAGAFSATPLQVPGLTDITSVVAGGFYGYALHSDGTVSGWGTDNPYVFLGDGADSNQLTPVPIPGLTNITQIATGNYATYAVRDDGTVWGWASSNDGGWLGDGSVSISRTPVQLAVSGVAAVAATMTNAFALTTTGDALAWGTGSGTGGGSATGIVKTPTAAPWLSQTVSLGVGQVDGFAVRLKPDME